MRGTRGVLFSYGNTSLSNSSGWVWHWSPGKTSPPNIQDSSVVGLTTHRLVLSTASNSD
ncbi:hypothetical protein BH24CHL3_BH24CHL3_09930 [soil metagenome]